MLAQTLHTFQDGNATVAAQIDGNSVVIAQTRSRENAAEGRFNELIAVVPLAEAVELAKRILALQVAAEDAEIDRMAAEWEERLDAERFNRECSIEADTTGFAPVARQGSDDRRGQSAPATGR